MSLFRLGHLVLTCAVLTCIYGQIIVDVMSIPPSHWNDLISGKVQHYNHEVNKIGVNNRAQRVPSLVFRAANSRYPFASFENGDPNGIQIVWWNKLNRKTRLFKFVGQSQDGTKLTFFSKDIKYRRKNRNKVKHWTKDRFIEKVNAGQVKLWSHGRWTDVRTILRNDWEYGIAIKPQSWTRANAHEEDGDDYYYYDDDDYDYMDEQYDQEEEESEYNLGYERGYQAAMERMLRSRTQWNY